PGPEDGIRSFESGIRRSKYRPGCGASGRIPRAVPPVVTFEAGACAMRTRNDGPGWFLARTAAMIIVVGSAMTTAARGQEAPRRGRPAPLARYFPRQGLRDHAVFEGLAAHRDRPT